MAEESATSGHMPNELTKTGTSAAIDVLPEVPPDGLLVKTLFVAVCHVSEDDSEVTDVKGHGICAKVIEDLSLLCILWEMLSTAFLWTLSN